MTYLKNLADNGFIVVDVFPFAFYEGNGKTVFTYGSLTAKQKEELFHISQEIHLAQKLSAISKKADKNVKAFFRYKRNQQFEPAIRQMFENLGFEVINIGCVGSDNIPISIEALEEMISTVSIE